MSASRAPAAHGARPSWISARVTCPPSATSASLFAAMMKSLRWSPQILWVHQVTATRPPLGEQGRMMTLLLGEGANPVREGQGVGEVREVEDPLEPGDAVAVQQVPIGDLVLEVRDLRCGHPGRVAAAGDAPFGRQCPHCAHLPGRLAPRPGSPPTSSDRAPRPAAVAEYLRRDTSSGAVCDGPQVDDGTAWEVVYAFGRNIEGGNPSKGVSKPSEGHRIPRSRVAPDSGRRRARRNGEARLAFFQHAVEKASGRPVYRLNEPLRRQSAATLTRDWVS